MLAKGHQHKAKLSGLGEREGEQPFASATHSKQRRESEKDGSFDQDQRNRKPENGDRRAEKDREIDACADGDEEQAQQKTFERLKVGFQLVAKFAAGKNNTRQESA